MSPARLQDAVADLRVIADAYEQSSNDDAHLDVPELAITDDPDPFDADRLYLSADAPVRNRHTGD
jgi:hypothetical protein